MIRKLVDFALNYRFVVIVLAILLVAWGAISFHNLPVEAYPDIADNYVTVITQWPGRSADRFVRLFECERSKRRRDCADRAPRTFTDSFRRHENQRAARGSARGSLDAGVAAIQPGARTRGRGTSGALLEHAGHISDRKLPRRAIVGRLCRTSLDRRSGSS